MSDSAVDIGNAVRINRASDNSNSSQVHPIEHLSFRISQTSRAPYCSLYEGRIELIRCTDVPGEEGYANTIFGKSNPYEAAVEADIVFGRQRGTSGTPGTPQTTDATGVEVRQTAHGFTVGTVVGSDSTGWYKSERNNPDKFGIELVVKVLDANRFEIAGANQVYDVTILGGSTGDDVYQGAAAGSLTVDYPAAKQVVARMGTIVADGKFFYRPFDQQEIAQ